MKLLSLSPGFLPNPPLPLSSSTLVSKPFSASVKRSPSLSVKNYDDSSPKPGPVLRGVWSFPWEPRPLPLQDIQGFLAQASRVDCVIFRLLMNPQYSMRGFSQHLWTNRDKSLPLSFLGGLWGLIDFTSGNDLDFLTELRRRALKSHPKDVETDLKLREVERRLLARRVQLGQLGGDLEAELLASAVGSDDVTDIDCLALLLSLPERRIRNEEICRKVWGHYLEVRGDSPDVRAYVKVLQVLEAEYGRVPDPVEMAAFCELLDPKVLCEDGELLFRHMTSIFLDPTALEGREDEEGYFRRLYLRLFQFQSGFPLDVRELNLLYDVMVKAYLGLQDSEQAWEPLSLAAELLPVLIKLLPHFRKQDPGLGERVARKIHQVAASLVDAKDYAAVRGLLGVLRTLDALPAKLFDAEKVKRWLLEVVRKTADEKKAWPTGREAARRMLEFDWVEGEDWKIVERFYSRALADSTPLAEAVRHDCFRDIAAHPELKRRLQARFPEFRGDRRVDARRDFLALVASSGLKLSDWARAMGEAYPFLPRAAKNELLRLSRIGIEWDSPLPKNDYFIFLRTFLRHGDLPLEQVDWLKRYFEREVDEDPAVLHHLIALDSMVDREWFVGFLDRLSSHRFVEARVHGLMLSAMFSKEVDRDWLQNRFENAFGDQAPNVRIQAYHLVERLRFDSAWVDAKLTQGLEDFNPEVRKEVQVLVAKRNGRLALPWLERKFSKARQGHADILAGYAKLGLGMIVDVLNKPSPAGVLWSFSEVFSPKSPLASGIDPEWLQRCIERKLERPLDADLTFKDPVNAVLTLNSLGRGLDPLWSRELLDRLLVDSNEEVVLAAYFNLQDLGLPWDQQWLRSKIEAGLKSPAERIQRAAYFILLSLGNLVEASWLKNVIEQNLATGDFTRQIHTYQALPILAAIPGFETELPSWIERGLSGESEQVKFFAGQAFLQEGERFNWDWRRQTLRKMWEKPSFGARSHRVAALRELIRLGELSGAEIESALGLKPTARGDVPITRLISQKK